MCVIISSWSNIHKNEKETIGMNKKVLKVISVVLAVMMVISTFTFAYAADNNAETKAVSDIINTDDATLSSIKALIDNYIKGYNERHSQPENQLMITLNGKQFDILSLGGAKGAKGSKM